jgi:lipopolysaccharide export LptBFGC system permease protein LptF
LCITISALQPVVLPIALFILLLTTLVVPWTQTQKSIIMERSHHTSEFVFIKQKEFQAFKNGEIVAIGKTTGCINTIKCLSPKPSEFITTASEFL